MLGRWKDTVASVRRELRRRRVGGVRRCERTKNSGRERRVRPRRPRVLVLTLVRSPERRQTTVCRRRGRRARGKTDPWRRKRNCSSSSRRVFPSEVPRESGSSESRHEVSSVLSCRRRAAPRKPEPRTASRKILSSGSRRRARRRTPQVETSSYKGGLGERVE